MTNAWPVFLESCIWLTLLLPLISAVLAYIISEKYSWAVSLTAPFLMLISAATAAYVFLSLWNESAYTVHWNWFTINASGFTAGVYINNLAVLMLLVVTLISFLVHLYSISYMAGDLRIKRYFSMLGFFTFSMVGIVVSDNLLLIFIFWELVGFSSYMLIGHWQEKLEAVAASKKSFLFNRIGDAGLLIGLLIIWAKAETFTLHALISADVSPWATAASLCIFCGVIGKSAQFPLLTWLPDAMKGPTPVSALIHAATMVAAGVFLLARVDFLFTPQALDVVACIGILTALLGALSALAQNDIKKILAYSTISQLGLMVTAAGVGSPDAAMLHLFTHAFFKACLFLCAGSVIHALHQAEHQAHTFFDVQDIRNMGGLRKKLPFTFVAMSISGAALAGIPFLSGFLSKDAILAAVYLWKGEEVSWRYLVLILAFVVSFVTVLYIFRMLWAIFFGHARITENLNVTEPPVVMRAPVALLAFASFWFIVNWNPFDFSGWLGHSAAPHSTGLTIFSLLWISVACVTAYFIYRGNAFAEYPLLANNFYFDTAYTFLIGKPVMKISLGISAFDKKWIDGFLHGTAYVQVTIAYITGWFDKAIVDGMVNGMAGIARMVGAFTRSFQGGKIQLYIFWTVFAIIIFLFWTVI